MITDATYTSPPVFQGRGAVFVKDRNGRWVQRGRAMPTKSQSPARTARTGRMAKSGVAWKMSLSPAQRLAWSVYATSTPIQTTRRGVKTLDPHLMYQLVQMIRLNAGITTPPTAPATAGLASVTAPVWSRSGDQLQLLINPTDAWAATTGGVALVNVELPQRNTASRWGKRSATIGVLHGDSSTPLPYTTLYSLPHGWPSDTAVYAELRVVDADGRPSNAGKSHVGPPFGPPVFFWGNELLDCSTGAGTGVYVATTAASPGLVTQIGGVCMHLPTPLGSPSAVAVATDLTGDPIYTSCAACARYNALDCTTGLPSAIWVDGTQATAGAVIRHAGVCLHFPTPLGMSDPTKTATNISGDPTYASCAACAPPAGCPTNCTTCGDPSHGGLVTVTVVGGPHAGVYTYACSGGTYTRTSGPSLAATLVCAIISGTVRWSFNSGAAMAATGLWFAACPSGPATPGGAGVTSVTGSP